MPSWSGSPWLSFPEPSKTERFQSIIFYIPVLFICLFVNDVKQTCTCTLTLFHDYDA